MSKTRLIGVRRALDLIEHEHDPKPMVEHLLDFWWLLSDMYQEDWVIGSEEDQEKILDIWHSMKKDYEKLRDILYDHMTPEQKEQAYKPL